MTQTTNWLLPDGFEEAMPEEALRLERLRSSLLQVFHSWGYQVVQTPLAEYLDSLLSGVGRDLDLLTCKITDQLTGKLMGIRADMTPQIARMDAHHLADSGPARYCYAGSVLRSRPAGPGEPREIFQTGAELFGCSGVEADLEILQLMAALLEQAGIADSTLDLGHAGVSRSLCLQAGFGMAQEKEYFSVLQSKSENDMQVFLGGLDIETALKTQLADLAGLHGGAEVLQRARQILDTSLPEVASALNTLDNIVARIADTWNQDHLYIDLAELRGYRYHTGIVFSAYTPGQGAAIARGGRYDDIAEAFGKNRPAIGFSADLRKLLRLVPAENAEQRAIVVKTPIDRKTAARVRELREQGETVIYWLPGMSESEICRRCNRILVSEGDTLLVRDF